MINDKIINTVYYPGSTIPLTSAQLAKEAGPGMRESDYPERISGKQCGCANGGKFTLLPTRHPAVQSGGKRYMVCRICGESSHL